MYDLVKAFSRHYIKRSAINIHGMNGGKKERHVRAPWSKTYGKTFLNNIRKLTHKYYIICMHENLLKSIYEGTFLQCKTANVFMMRIGRQKKRIDECTVTFIKCKTFFSITGKKQIYTHTLTITLIHTHKAIPNFWRKNELLKQNKKIAKIYWMYMVNVLRLNISNQTNKNSTCN